MSEDRTPVLTGGCQCGAVRYALYAPPEDVHICHCRMCQKAVGGPFAPLAPVRKGDFQWTRGSPGAFRSSTIAERHFCRDCGTPLTFHYVNSDWIDVTIGSLDAPEEAPPANQYGIEGRLSWFAGLHALPGEETSLPAAQKRRIASFQHPDHDTPPDWRPPQTATEMP
ncbi:GFA family protein [Rhodobium gokarnense]|uniref:CENP-V/GFA domain-containing protein n=1 Tax=Rhodobium gokarnense TaxID=364296 RepID=A0ABT3HC45_9HYPH|nr:GFA family protein [Rhodobium gokarnense]MCW2307945.1 hypothetical protein [Rhodobium gokarnense]